MNDQLDVDSLVREMGLDSAEIRWRKEFIGFGEEDVRRLERYRESFAENAEQSQAHASDIEETVTEIQDDTERTVTNLTDTTEQVDRGVERVQDAMNNLEGIVETITETAEGISEVSDATDDQAAAAEEIASMVDSVVEQADRVAAEIEDLAAANEEQAAMVSEVEESVSRLSGSRSETDGGRATGDTTAPDSVSIPEDLPDGMPDFVIEMLPEEQLRDVARGDLDPEELR